MDRSIEASPVATLPELGHVAPVIDSAAAGAEHHRCLPSIPQARVLIGADLGASHGRAVLVNLAREVETEFWEMLPIVDGPEAVVGWLAGAIGRLVAEAGCAESELVDNDVNMPTDEDILFVKVATGIGAGSIAAGNLERSARGTARRLGHVRVPGGADTLCLPAGIWDVWTQGPAARPSPRSWDFPPDRDRTSRPWLPSRCATAMPKPLPQAGPDLGSALAICASLLSPAVIAIVGSLAQVGEHLLEGIPEVVYQRSLPLATKHLRIIACSSGSDAGVFSAVALAPEFALSPKVIEPASN